LQSFDKSLLATPEYKIQLKHDVALQVRHLWAHSNFKKNYFLKILLLHIVADAA